MKTVVENTTYSQPDQDETRQHVQSCGVMLGMNSFSILFFHYFKDQEKARKRDSMRSLKELKDHNRKLYIRNIYHDIIGFRSQSAV